MEELKIGMPEEHRMPPEPPQKRAEELGLKNHAADRKKKNGFAELKQPERHQPKKEESKVVKPVSKETAKAEAIRPNIEKPKKTVKGKIARKAPKGAARPL